MANASKKPRMKQAWRPYLTEDERVRLVELDSKLALAELLIEPFVEEHKAIIKRARQRLERRRWNDRYRKSAA